jgi:YesN/AraC family two-component response regulator
VKNSLIREKLRNLDIHYKHPSYALEQKLLSEIKQGYLVQSKITLEEINALERPALARDSIRSIKNSLIGSCTLFTRATIEAGIDSEDAFDLSDVFIKHLESIDNEFELLEFEYEMLETFIKLVQNTVIFNYPFPISKVVKHIYENATSKITVSHLAEFTHLSPDYLSKLFFKEVGMSITDYIQKQKIEVAKNFIQYSEMKITDIALLLEYCNPGYFSNVFKQHTGYSPATYRKMNNKES